MPREVNPCGRTVKRENAYEVWATPDLSFVWYVLKKYQAPTKEAKNPYARWYCNVVSPMTSERGDTGDVYVADMKRYAVKLDYNPLVYYQLHLESPSADDSTKLECTDMKYSKVEDAERAFEEAKRTHVFLSLYRYRENGEVEFIKEFPPKVVQSTGGQHDQLE